MTPVSREITSPPVFAVTFPPTLKLWSHTHMGWSPPSQAQRAGASEQLACGQGQILPLPTVRP